MSREQANLFFQVVAQHYERGSMILTSNLTFGGFRRRRRAHRGDARSYPPPLYHRQHGRNAKLIFRTEIGFNAEVRNLYRRPDYRLRGHRKPPVEVICVY
jgi:IstB-like ATP binding protein